MRPQSAGDLSAEEDTVSAADNRLILPCDIVSETKTRSEVDPFVGFERIVARTNWSDIEIRIQQAVRIVETRQRSLVASLRDEVGEQIVPNSEVQGQIAANPPVGLG